MIVKVFTSDEFVRCAKRFAKKYKSFTADFSTFLSVIKENPYQGIDLGGGKRKVRLSVASKNKGKSGGFRVITYNVVENVDDVTIDVYLITVYDKSEYSSVSDSYINQIIEGLNSNH